MARLHNPRRERTPNPRCRRPARIPSAGLATISNRVRLDAHVVAGGRGHGELLERPLHERRRATPASNGVREH